MSKRYSRCRSAKLGALCPPMPVFKYAMLTPGPGRQKSGAGIRRGGSTSGGTELGLGRKQRKPSAPVQTLASFRSVANCPPPPPARHL